MRARLLRLYRRLAEQFGRQHWWPARTPFAVAVGAVLTQNTAWTGAARAVAVLERRRLLTPARLVSASERAIGGLIRPAGTYRLKARHLKNFTRWLLERFDGRFGRLRAEPLGPLRRELLAVRGLGPETTDAILLYAAGRPVFVADASTRRVLARHRLVGAGVSYEEARAFLEAHLPSDPALFNEYHALLVALAKSHCRTIAHCSGCPLRFDLRGRPPAPLDGRSPAKLSEARAPRSASPTARRRRTRKASAPARPFP